MGDQRMSRFWGGVVACGLVVVVLVGGFVLYTVLDHAWQMRDIMAQADRLAPPPHWQLVEERIEKPQLVCLSKVTCPSVRRVWLSDGDPAEADAFLADFGRPFPRPRAGFTRGFNSMDLEESGYWFSCTIRTSNSEPSKYEIAVLIQTNSS